MDNSNNLLKADLDREREQTTRFTEEVFRRDKQISKLQSDLESITTRSNEYAADVALLKNDLATTESKCQIFEQEIEQANDIITKLQSDARTYKSRYKKAAADAVHLLKENTTLKESSANLSTENNTLKERLADLEKEFLEEKSAKKITENELKQAQATIERHTQSKNIDVLTLFFRQFILLISH